MGARVLGLLALVIVACGCTKPDRTSAPIYPEDGDGEGGEKKEAKAADIDDDGAIRELFLELAEAKRIRTCAPANASWVILTYSPDILDEHRVRTREVHCQERVVSERCQLVTQVDYYLVDPNDYFAVEGGVSPEKALQVAELSLELADGKRLLSVSADKRATLITLGKCGSETQLAVKVTGSGAKRKLHVIETRSSIEL